MSKAEIKRKKQMEFLTLIDGVFDIEPVFKGIDSYKLGICKLKYMDNELHVYLRRPGLLIGQYGKTINAIQKVLGCKIKLHEINLVTDIIFKMG